MVRRDYIARIAVSGTAFLLPLQGISMLPGGGGLFSPLVVFSPFFLVCLVVATPYLKVEFKFVVAFAIILVSFLSACWNLLFPNPTVIHTYTLEIIKFSYSPKDLVRLFRIIYSVLFVVIFVEAITKHGLREKFYKIYLYGFLVGAFFGLLQLLRNFVNIPFWSPFGNVDWALSNQIIKVGSILVYRVNGGALEPSHWAPLCFFAWYALLSLNIGGIKKNVLLLIIFGNLLGTLSGTMMVGFLGIGFFWIIKSVTNLKLSPKAKVSKLVQVIIGFSVLICFVLFVITNAFVNEVLFESLISKLQGQSVSGIERFKILDITWAAFVENPIFGVGVGPLVSFNTFLTILASGGILLFIPYLALLITGVRKTILEDSPISKVVLYGSFFFMTSMSYGEVYSFMSWLWMFILL